MDFFQMRLYFCKDNKFGIPDFLMKENDITKLFLMRLQVYADFTRGMLATDDVRINQIERIVNCSFIKDTLQYKLELTREIREVFRLNNTTNLIIECESYLNSIILNAEEKSVLYSTFDDRLFCYYVWAETLKINNKLDIKDYNIYLSEKRAYLELINSYVFNQKFAIFHEQRKLIVMLNVERNIDFPLQFNVIKSRWSKICAHGAIVRLDEKNPNFVEWVLKYTINFIENDIIYNGNNFIISPFFAQQMVTIKDKIEGCYTLMHCYIFCDNSYLSEFKKKISLAIAQQERRNRTKKELSSIKLSKKHEQKLKELIQYKKVSKKQLLENLIDNYYDNVTS